MLQEPHLQGPAYARGIVVPCPAIVNEEMWEAVQRVTEQCRQQHTGRPSKNKYLVARFSWCAKCTRRCITSPGKQASGNRYPYYRCGNIEYKPYKRRCHAPEGLHGYDRERGLECHLAAC